MELRRTHKVSILATPQVIVFFLRFNRNNFANQFIKKGS